MECSFEECDNMAYSKSLCGGHYRQQARGQTLRRLYGGRYRDHKICTKCGQDKPVSDYYLATTGSPRSRCKVCTNEDARARRGA